MTTSSDASPLNSPPKEKKAVMNFVAKLKIAAT